MALSIFGLLFGVLLLADFVEDFGAVDSDFGRGGEAEADLLAVDLGDGDGDGFSFKEDDDGLIGFAGEDEHENPFRGARKKFCGKFWEVGQRVKNVRGEGEHGASHAQS